MTWFTGVYPSEHRMVNKFTVYNSREQKIANLKDVAPNLTTLATILKQNGYATGGFTGNAGVSGGFGYDSGFDTYYFKPNTFGGFDESIPRALNWLRANCDRKFFLFLHGYDVHGQRAPTGGYDYRYADPQYDKRYTGAEHEQERLREEGLDRGQITLRDADVQFWRAIYDEKISRADAKFRDFLTEFDKLGVSGRTIFVLTSDHGTEFYEHRRFDHGFTLYNEQIHVPLVVVLPHETGGEIIRDRVSSIDVMPTILELLAIRLPEQTQKQLRGTSLVATMQNNHTARDVYFETDYRMYTYKRGLITPEGWKFIYTLESRSRELFDLNTDPQEQHNLEKSHTAKADELQKKLFAHFAAIGHDLTARKWETGLNPVYASQAKDGKK
jgi:arylsulfatase A-like enzyme